jgi:hypothetical protein
MTVVPSFAPNCSLKARANISLLPPVVKGTTSLMLDGSVGSATNAEVLSIAKTKPKLDCATRAKVFFIWCLFVLVDMFNWAGYRK